MAGVVRRDGLREAVAQWLCDHGSTRLYSRNSYLARADRMIDDLGLARVLDAVPDVPPDPPAADRDELVARLWPHCRKGRVASAWRRPALARPRRAARPCRVRARPEDHMSTRCDPSWQDQAPAYCPFSGDGVCPSAPPCPTNRDRVCVNGLDDDIDVTECPDCGKTGRYDRRVLVNGRGAYRCPDGHVWQDANERPTSKGVPLSTRWSRPPADTDTGRGQ